MVVLRKEAGFVRAADHIVGDIDVVGALDGDEFGARLVRRKEVEMVGARVEPAAFETLGHIDLKRGDGQEAFVFELDVRHEFVVVAERDYGIPVREIIFLVLFHGEASVGKRGMAMQVRLVLDSVGKQILFHFRFCLSAVFTAFFVN